MTKFRKAFRKFGALAALLGGLFTLIAALFGRTVRWAVAAMYPQSATAASSVRTAQAVNDRAAGLERRLSDALAKKAAAAPAAAHEPADPVSLAMEQAQRIMKGRRLPLMKLGHLDPFQIGWIHEMDNATAARFASGQVIRPALSVHLAGMRQIAGLPAIPTGRARDQALEEFQRGVDKARREIGQSLGREPGEIEMPGLPQIARAMC